MDALEFLREQKRMCSLYKNCDGCPAWDDSCKLDPGGRLECDADEKLKIVNEWSVSHPINTRQSVFLEQFPEAELDVSGVITICPAPLSEDYRDGYGGCKHPGIACRDCRREFWMQEIE